MPEPGPTIFDHAPEPGPQHWDWRCLVCSEPVAAHAGWFGRWKWRRRGRPDPDAYEREFPPPPERRNLIENPGFTEGWTGEMVPLERTEVWTCWRCTHELCDRLAQSWEVDHAGLLLEHAGAGKFREEFYQRLQMACLELTRREEDPPKCIGCRTAKGGYYSHKAAPMELVEVQIVPGSKYVDDKPTKEAPDGRDASDGPDRRHDDRVGSCRQKSD